MGVEIIGNLDLNIDINKQIEEIIKDTCKEMVSMVANRSPKDTGIYSEGWTWRMDGSVGVVYNDGAHNFLSQWLEYGHWNVKAKKYVEPRPHIFNSYEYMKNQFENELQKIKFNK